jgi:multicomponent Na+:H+ antiporter subunit A
VALVLVLVGAFTKSAQYPFHSWLPAAMVAPTPISAYLHSAAMVKAGVYLVARLSPAFADVGIWRPLVVSVGLVTMIAGGLRALRPFDLKRLLAFGTISQLGFLMVLFGLGQPEATAAGCALLLAHGLFKAALFMVVGIVDHEVHTRDIRRLPAFGPGWTATKIVAVASAASMAAIPPFAGFIAKESAYDALIDGSAGDRGVLAGIVVGSVLTVAYSVRIVAALLRPDLVGRSAGPRSPAQSSPATAFLLPAAVLAGASLALGVAPVLWSSLIDAASTSLDPASGAHLALWHGFTPAVALSLLTIGAGGALFSSRHAVAVIQRRVAPPWSSATVYRFLVRTLTRTAGRVTSIVQPGSLPIYAAIILLTAAVAPTTAMMFGPWWSGWPDLFGHAAHVPIATLLMGGAVTATIAKRRFAAALLLGVVGYGMAMLFVAQGAPDLALTQFAVETLSIVVFLLVLRQLPDRFEQRAPAIARVLRLGVSAAVGGFVLLMALASAGSRTEPSVSRAMSEQALPEGDGRNVVNVILVDIRGLDTLGEITVLVVAAIGITSLARVRPHARTVRRRSAPASVGEP